MPRPIPAGARRDPTDHFGPRRAVRLTDADWLTLERIAAREGLIYGAFPSRSQAIRWLIRRDDSADQPGERSRP